MAISSRASPQTWRPTIRASSRRSKPNWRNNREYQDLTAGGGGWLAHLGTSGTIQAQSGAPAVQSVLSCFARLVYSHVPTRMKPQCGPARVSRKHGAPPEGQKLTNHQV